MKINEQKLAKQKQIIEDWKAARARGTVVAVTGFGKSFVAVLVVKDMNERHPDRRTVIIVPTLVLKKQWETEVKAHKLKNVQVIVVNTAIKNNYETELLVLDEIHRYAADQFSRVFSNIKYHFILGLTATLERSDKKHSLLTARAPVVAKIDMREARDSGYISDYKVYNIPLEILDDDKSYYDSINRKFIRNFAVFSHNFDLAMKALKDPFTVKMVAEQIEMEEDKVKIAAINFARYMAERKKFLNEHPAKLREVLRIVKKYPLKTIVFSETTDFADQITAELGSVSVSYHSGLGKKKRQENLNKFKDGRTKVRVISSARALDEGFNVEGIELAIICSGNSTSRQGIQRIGRAIRFKEGKEAIIVNLYVQDSQDERWTRKRMTGIPNVFWINKLEDIDDYFKETINAVDEGASVPFSFSGYA